MSNPTPCEKMAPMQRAVCDVIESLMNYYRSVKSLLGDQAGELWDMIGEADKKLRAALTADKTSN